MRKGPIMQGGVYFSAVGQPEPPCFVCGGPTKYELRLEAHDMFTAIDLHPSCRPAFREMVTAAKLAESRVSAGDGT